MERPPNAERTLERSTPHEAPGGAPWLPRGLGALLWGAALMLTGASCVGFMGRLWWVFDLANHFRVQYLVLACTGAVVAAFFRRRGPLVLLLACVSVGLYLIYPFYAGYRVGSSDVSLGPERLRVATINVNVNNRNQADLREVIAKGSPDVFFVLEYSEFWQTALRSLEAEYPHTIQIPGEGSFGMAAYSRLPFVERRVLGLEQPAFAAIELHVMHSDIEWTLIGIHVVPPVSFDASALRNRQFTELAEHVHGKPGPIAVLGDLNCTSWSPFFDELLAASGLRDTQLGRGVQPTWPDHLPVLGIPIDHCLVSRDVDLGLRRVTGPFGSDHRGLSVELVAGNRTSASDGP